MIKCLACNKVWIQEELGFICEECTPNVLTDMIIVDLLKNIDDVCKLEREQINKHKNHLLEVQNKLSKLLE